MSENETLTTPPPQVGGKNDDFLAAMRRMAELESIIAVLIVQLNTAETRLDSLERQVRDGVGHCMGQEKVANTPPDAAPLPIDTTAFRL